MNANKKVYKYLKYFTMISQLGISVVAPLALCIIGALWLKNRFSLGDWVVLAGILLGIASGISSFVNYLKGFLQDMRKSDEEYYK